MAHADHPPLTPTPPEDGREGEAASFAVARPRGNVTILRYAVPHETRNGLGNPLPKAQATLFPGDAAAVLAVLRRLFPLHFPFNEAPSCTSVSEHDVAMSGIAESAV